MERSFKWNDTTVTVRALTNSQRLNRPYIHGYILEELGISFDNTDDVPVTAWNVVMTFSDCMLATSVDGDFPVTLPGAYATRDAYVQAFREWDTISEELLALWLSELKKVNSAPEA